MGGGARKAAVHGVAEGRTQLSPDFHNLLLCLVFKEFDYNVSWHGFFWIYPSVHSSS